MQIANRVWFRKPMYSMLKRQGFNLVDMHVHTPYSDGWSSTRMILKKARKLGIGVAITDHNEIGGAVELAKEDLLVIPGIEVNSNINKDILLYFYGIDELIEFYEKKIVPFKKMWPKYTVSKTVTEILEDAKKYNCIASIPHPYGYLYKNIIKTLGENPRIMQLADAIEVITGSNVRIRNKKAINLAQKHEKAFTAGSDAHSVAEFGNVVTFSHADDVESFLNNIKKKQNFVMGRESNKMRASLQAGINEGRKIKTPFRMVGSRTSESIKNGIVRMKPRMGNIKSRILHPRINLRRRVKL